MLFAVLCFCFVEYVLRRQYPIFREWEEAFLSFQWLLMFCLLIWCSSFLVFTFKLRDLPLIGLLLIGCIAYLLGYAGRPAIDAPNFLTGITLGKGASFAFKSKQTIHNARVQGALTACNLPSAIYTFLASILGLLGCAACWHLNMTGNFYNGPRWMGLWDNPNTYGVLMGAGSVLAIGLQLANSKIKSSKANLFLGIVICLLVVGLVMSYSRGAWSGAVVGLLYLSWCYNKLKWRYMLLVAGIIAATLLFYWGRTPDNAPWFVKRADLGRASAQNRVTAWRAGLHIMYDHPLGVGWNNAVKIYGERYSPPEGGPAALTTNDYLMIGTELGIAALACFVSYCALCLRDKYRIGNEEGRIQVACRAGVIVFLVAFWFDGGLFKLPVAALFWILLELGTPGLSRQRQ